MDYANAYAVSCSRRQNFPSFKFLRLKIGDSLPQGKWQNLLLLIFILIDLEAILSLKQIKVQNKENMENQGICDEALKEQLGGGSCR